MNLEIIVNLNSCTSGFLVSYWWWIFLFFSKLVESDLTWILIGWYNLFIRVWTIWFIKNPKTWKSWRLVSFTFNIRDHLKNIWFCYFLRFLLSRILEESFVCNFNWAVLSLSSQTTQHRRLSNNSQVIFTWFLPLRNIVCLSQPEIPRRAWQFVM